MNKKVLSHTGNKSITCYSCNFIVGLDVTDFDAPYSERDDNVNIDAENAELGYIIEVNIFCPNCNTFIENGFVPFDKVYFEE